MYTMYTKTALCLWMSVPNTCRSVPLFIRRHLHVYVEVVNQQFPFGAVVVEADGGADWTL